MYSFPGSDLSKILRWTIPNYLDKLWGDSGARPNLVRAACHFKMRQLRPGSHDMTHKWHFMIGYQIADLG